jgi:hypothetical protein
MLINPYIYADAFANDYSMSFDGTDDYLYINNVENDIDTLFRSQTPQFTVAGWFKYTGGTPTQHPILSKYRFETVSDCDSAFQLRYQTGGNLAWFSNYSAGNSFVGLITTQFLTASTWNHFTVIYDYSQIAADNIAKMFINGQRVTSFTNKEILLANKTFFNAAVADRANVKIGHSSYKSTNSYFIGMIDEISIWNKNLSDTEASELYNSGTAKNLSDMTAYTTNCIAWYRNGDLSSDNWDGSKWNIYNKKGTTNTDMISTGMIEANRLTDAP